MPRLMPPSISGRKLDDPGAILAERARKLAQPRVVASVGATVETISFLLTNETYAIETRYVISAFRLTAFAPLPGAPAPVFGLAVWRGDLLTLIDLRPALGLSVTALNDLSRVLVLGYDRPVFGLVVDDVRDLKTIRESEIGPLPSATPRNRRYLRGMTPDAVLVLDGDPLLRLLKPTANEIATL